MGDLAPTLENEMVKRYRLSKDRTGAEMVETKNYPEHACYVTVSDHEQALAMLQRELAEFKHAAGVSCSALAALQAKLDMAGRALEWIAVPGIGIDMTSEIQQKAVWALAQIKGDV